MLLQNTNEAACVIIKDHSIALFVYIVREQHLNFYFQFLYFFLNQKIEIIIFPFQAVYQ